MPLISLFKRVAYTKFPEDMQLIDFLEKTRDGEWEDIVTQCRLIKDDKKRKEFKEEMPTATLSGQFIERNDGGLTEHSEYINIDIDDLENINNIKYILCQDKYVYACWVSTSGTGLRVLFHIDKSKHRESYIGISQYLYDRYDITSIDVNGKALSKPYVVSWDPALYYSPDSVPMFKKYVKETIIKKLPDFIHTDDDFKNVLLQITSRKVNICESYEEWIKVGFALSEKFGENGRQYFHDISSQSSRYKYEEANKQFTRCLKAKGQVTPVNIATFYYYAKSNNIEITSERTKNIVRTTKNGKKTGLKPDQIIANLEKFYNIVDVEDVVKEIFDQRNFQGDDEEESILHGLEIFISGNYSLKMNEVTGYLEMDGKPQYSADLNTIFIAAKKVLPKLDYLLMMRLLKSDFIETYNPFFKFLGSDGIPFILPATPVPVAEQPVFDSPLIDLLASTIVNDNPSYTLYFTRKWIVGIISAMHKVHSPLLHALLGGQNKGKTEWYRRLLPNVLKQYYAESKLDKGTDDELLMTENILIMDDELDGKTNKDKKKLNATTSKEFFSLRRPYGDHNEKVLRYAVLCGTSNYPESVLSDPTGNRRVIPIDVTDINKELYNSINKDDLFREAFSLYKQGFDWRINKEDIPELNRDAEKYEVTTKEKELILKYFTPGSDYWLSTTEILVEIEILTKQKLLLTTIGRELLKIGFDRKTVRMGAYITVKKWGIRRNKYDEIHAQKQDKDDNPPF